jgi:hypothetical protein
MKNFTSHFKVVIAILDFYNNRFLSRKFGIEKTHSFGVERVWVEPEKVTSRGLRIPFQAQPTL